MYLARFSIDEIEYVQGAVSLTLDHSDQSASRSADNLHAQLARIVASLDHFAPTCVALRLTCDRGKLSNLMIVTVTSAREKALREWIAALSRLEREVPDSVLLMGSVEEHDRALVQPGQQVSVSAPVFVYRDHEWVERTCRVVDRLDAIFERAIMENISFCYQAVLTPHRASSATLRRLRLDALRLADIPGFGAERLATVNATIHRYSSTRWLIAETAWLPEQEASWLEERFSEICNPSEADEPRVTPGGPWEEGAGDGLCLAHLPHSPVGLSDVASSADVDVLLRLLGWKSALLSNGCMDRRPPAAPDFSDPPPLDGTALVELSDPLAEFLFISYARGDTPIINSVLKQLDRNEIRYWYDNHLKIGDSWISRIEERLEKCKAVLLFLSKSSVKSRYVKSEALFAYTLGKPILVVSVDEATLTDGLRIALNGLQKTRIGSPDLYDMIRRFFSASPLSCYDA